MASLKDDPPFGRTSFIRVLTCSGIADTASSPLSKAYICFATFHATGMYLIASITTDPAMKMDGNFSLTSDSKPQPASFCERFSTFRYNSFTADRSTPIASTVEIDVSFAPTPNKALKS